MGIFDLAGKLVSAAVKTVVVLPVSVAADIVTGGGDAANGGESHMQKALTDIGDDLADGFDSLD